MLEWIAGTPTLLWWLTAIALAFSTLAAIALPVIIAQLPEDYFVQINRPPLQSLDNRHPVARVIILVVKNLLGIVLAVAGVIMLVTPGPGIIALLLSITLVNFPGKRQLQLRMAQNRLIHKILDAIRAKAERPVFILPNRRSDRT